MIRLTDIHKEYQNGTKALKGVSLQIDDGEFVFLVGPSGSGKSTIIKLITAEIEATRGKLMVNGYNLRDISEKQIPLMRRTIGVVFQDFRLIEKKTVYENIEVAMRAVGATTREIQRRIPYVLDLVGLMGKGGRLPTQLSGGEQQRVAIARALASEAPVILADEPTGNLDEDTAQDITDILKESAHKMNKCVVVVTHSNELAKQADVVFRLRKGELQVLERVQDGAAQPQSRRNNAPRSERRAH